MSKKTPKNIAGENYHIMVGNALDRLKELPDNSVDSIVTDPPYGLSDNKFVAETIAKWIEGEREFIPDGKGFMGKAWDAFVPPPAIWDECMRVLKPGGHLLAFFGTRTQDIGALAIRLAGFEIRDSVAWLYGSGFPKSLDISKAIDKNNGETDRLQRFTAFMRTTGLTAKQLNDATNSSMGSHYLTEKSQPAIATSSYWKLIRPLITIEIPEWVDQLVERIEAEREVIGKQEVWGRGVERFTDIGEDVPVDGNASINITAPSTDAAKQYEGWGTALKPAHEPIVVARKPISEKTVANNVLQWGTGGLNIDASRVGFVSEADYKESTQKNQHGDFGTKPMEGNNTYGDWSMIEPKNYKPSGRFPANLILSHSEDCEDTGETTEVKAGVWNSTAGAKPFNNDGEPTGYETKNKDSVDTVPVYRCVPGCPVAELDEQSGKLSPGHWAKTKVTGFGEFGNGSSDYQGVGEKAQDTGGASRFFYVAKASKKDRNEGLDELAIKRPDERTSTGMGSFEEKGVQPQSNFHPTVKPTALMEYLVRMVTPEGGTVLDPFTGSGSTGKAAILSGFKFIGCELTEDYLPIIEGRLSWAEANKEQYQADKVKAAQKAAKVEHNTPSKATGGSLTALDAAEVALQAIAKKKGLESNTALPLFEDEEGAE